MHRLLKEYSEVFSLPQATRWPKTNERATVVEVDVY